MLIVDSTDKTSGPQAAPAPHFTFLSGAAQPLQQAADGQRFWAVHPSRSVPKCVDCSHAAERDDSHWLFCNHPMAPLSLVSNEPDLRCKHARDGSDNALCGPDARLFQARENAPEQA